MYKNTGWITDFENEEEIVQYNLIDDDGDLMLAELHTEKAIYNNEFKQTEKFLFLMKRETFNTICKVSKAKGIINNV